MIYEQQTEFQRRRHEQETASGIVQFDTNDYSKLTCKECGHDSFTFEFAVIEIPYIYQAAFSGQKHMNIQYYKCNNEDSECSHALDEMISVPPERKNNVVDFK